MEACLPYCQRYGVRDAEGFLLERLGDVSAAVKLYTASLAEANRQLVTAVMAGRIILPRAEQSCVTAAVRR